MLQLILPIIKSHEGLKLTAYKCPGNCWTIGYGSRIRQSDRKYSENWGCSDDGNFADLGLGVVEKSGKFVDSSCTFDNLPLQKITEVQAEKMLLERISEFEIEIKKSFKNIEKLNNNQYSALVSLVYNCGIKTIGSGLRNLIENDADNFEKITEIWLKYNKSSGKVLQGLIKRRQEEIELYCASCDSSNVLNSSIEPTNAARNDTNNSKSQHDKTTSLEGLINTAQNTFFKPMSNSILSTLTEKGIDIAASFIPGGSLVQSAVKSIAKSLLGNENASEAEVAKAVQNANPEQLEQIRLEIARFESQTKIEEEDTKQAIEQTRQFELKNAEKLMDLVIQLVQNGNGKYVAIAAIFYYILLILVGIFYHFSDFDLFTRHCVLGLLTVMCFIPFSSFIGNGVMNRILNSLCDIFLNIAEIGKGISSMPKMLANKVLKK